MVTIQLERVNGEYGFRATDEDGHSIQTDTGPDNGGLGFGVRPMQALLMALGSCSAIDVVSILKKQRQTPDSFSITIKGEREKDVVPALWKTVEMHFTLSGDIDEEKARKACSLSIDKYCSVAETLRRAGASIEWKLTVVKQTNS